VAYIGRVVGAFGRDWERSRRAWSGLSALILLSTCRATPRDAPGAASSSPAASAIATRSSPLASASAAPAVPALAALRGFECARRLGPGKGPDGVLRARFRFKSAADFTLHIEFHCEANCPSYSGTCDYAEDLRGENGVLKNAFPGLEFRCTQSSVDAFAVECGPLLGSDVQTVVTAHSVSHRVRLQIPFTFTQGIPDWSLGEQRMGCLPFVSYDLSSKSAPRKFINNDYFDFEKADCTLDR
jgi:hypothetical protein